MHGSFRDRLDLDKPSIIKMAMAVGISVCIMLIVFFTQGVPKGEHNADMTRMEQGITTLGSKVADNSADIAGLQTDTQQYSGVAATVVLHTTNINLMEGRLNGLNGDIDTLQDKLATVGSPPEAYLTGNFTSGNLTLHAKAHETGNYTANVHLVFAPPISTGNVTTQGEAMAAFYGSVNWTVTNAEAYVPVLTYNGSTWGVSQVWWNIGTFALAADTDTDISVVFGGLNTTYASVFAYVEIYPVLKG